MKQIKIFIITIITGLALSSCITSPVCITSSVTPLQDKTVTENLGECSGSASAYSILGIFMIGKPDINRAISGAVNSKKGDSLINVRCYETYAWFGFFSISTVTVEGEAIKFAQPAAGDDKKGKGK